MFNLEAQEPKDPQVIMSDEKTFSLYDFLQKN